MPTIAAAAAVAITTLGCGSSPAAAPPGETTITGQRTPITTTALATPRRDHPSPNSPGHHHDHSPTRAPAPLAQARATVTAFAAAWARPHLDPAAWRRDLQPLCEPRFAAQLTTVDPAAVPARAITGQPTPITQPAGGPVSYRIPTDAGTLTVTLANINGRWLVVGNDFVRSVR